MNEYRTKCLQNHDSMLSHFYVTRYFIWHRIHDNKRKYAKILAKKKIDGGVDFPMLVL